METERRCPFYRSSGSPIMDYRHGYCEFDFIYTICNGETKLCNKLESLKEYLMGREWMKVKVKVEKTIHYLEEQWQQKEIKKLLKRW
jgi:hypothetical protein